MYSTMDRETLAECPPVFGITCLTVAMRLATSEPTNSPTRTASLLSTALLAVSQLVMY